MMPSSHLPSLQTRPGREVYLIDTHDTSIYGNANMPQCATTGTVTHMAPEVLKDGVVAQAADIYAFGILSEARPTMQSASQVKHC